MTEPQRQFRAALVDLDGTMLDTAPDLEAAANVTLASLGLAPVPPGKARDFIGKGISVFIRRCLEAKRSLSQKTWTPPLYRSDGKARRSVRTTPRTVARPD